MKLDHGTGVKRLEINDGFASHLQVSRRFVHQDYQSLMAHQTSKLRASRTVFIPASEFEDEETTKETEEETQEDPE